MICRQCEAQIPDDSESCPNCGTLPDPQGNNDGTPFQPQGNTDSPDIPQYLPTVSSPTADVKYQLNLNKLLGDTFELYKRCFGTMCLIGLVLFGIAFLFAPLHMLISMLQQVAVRAEGPEAGLFFAVLVGCDWFFSIIQNLLQFYLTLGAIRHALYIARGGTDFQIKLMFPPFMMYLRMIGFSLIFMGISIVVLLPALFLIVAGSVFVATTGGFNAESPGPGIIFIALIGTGILCGVIGWCFLIWFGVRMYPAQFFIADRDMGVIDSLKQSWHVSSGNFWALFLGSLVLGLCGTSGMLLCCIGFFLTIAIPWLGGGLAYLQLTGQANCLDYSTSRGDGFTPV